PVSAAAFAPDGKLALSGDSRGGLLLWEVESRSVVRRIRGGRSAVLRCAVAPNGKYAISGGADGRVRLWGLANGEPIDLLNAAWADWVDAGTYSTGGGDAAGFATAAFVGGLVGAMIYTAATSGGGSGYEDRCGLALYTVEGGVRGQPLSGVNAPVVHVAVSPD